MAQSNMKKYGSYWKPYKKMSKAERRRKNRRSYALRKNVRGSYTEEDIRIQYIFQNGCCFWCMEELSDNFHRDHLKPLARGGTSHPTNIVLSCPHCNLSRGGKMPKNWRWRKVFAYW